MIYRVRLFNQILTELLCLGLKNLIVFFGLGMIVYINWNYGDYTGRSFIKK
jgi:hypothetical protein